MNLADKAYDLIRKDILTCSLLPGQQIVQAQLVDKYKMGTTPIREALQRLTHDGLVQPVPRSGYVVSHITFNDLRELYELRSVIEMATVRFAAIRGTEEQLRKIAERANFTYIYNNREDYIRFLERNRDFHCSIAEIGGNKRLTETLSRLLDEMFRIFHLGLDLRDSAEEMREEHVSLAKALCDRDDDLAMKLVSNQITQSLQRVVEAIMRDVQSGASDFSLNEFGQAGNSMILGDKLN
jgi:DNA-binding GntR family transcriptional regulator